MQFKFCLALFKPKIMVEIIYKNLDIIKKKCKITENKVQIRKGRRGHGGIAWNPIFTKESILEVKSRFLLFFKRTQKKLMVLDGAEKCLEFNEKNVDLHGLNRQSLEELANLEVIRRSGQVRIKHELPFIFWLLVALSAGALVLQIMQMRGIYFG